MSRHATERDSEMAAGVIIVDWGGGNDLRKR
jgi:hypothetical protein